MQSFNYITDLLRSAVEEAHPVRVTGRVIEVKGTIIKAVVPGVKLGEVCDLRNAAGVNALQAEVVGFNQSGALLTPIGDMHGISTVTEVTPTGRAQQVSVGPGMKVLSGISRRRR